MYKFKAVIHIIGINPFVYVPEPILKKIFNQAGKDKGHIPIFGTVNDKPYRQTLVKYSGEWRLYVNTTMLKNSPKRIGEKISVTVCHDPEKREVKPPRVFILALKKDPTAKEAFSRLSPSRKHEIVRYLASLKKPESLDRNVNKVIGFLHGEQRFAGREKP